MRDVAQSLRAERGRAIRWYTILLPIAPRRGIAAGRSVNEAQLVRQAPQDREKTMEYGIIGWIVVGLIAGVLAKWIMPGRDPGGIIVTILIGIVGGLVGGFIGSQLGIGGGNFVNILLATAGAILLLWIYRMVKGRTA
jgi:uncharacterized membrane protein YeaQ/YmgE (transglycosylase-associated protein family)